MTAAASTPLILHTSQFVDDFIDVPELNASASDDLLGRIAAVRALAREHRRSPSNARAILGPAGGGKTHLVSRLRRAAGAQATLVLVRPYFGVSLSLRDILATTIDQLCRRPNGATVSQLDLVTAYWLAPEESAQFPTATALEVRTLSPDERARLVDDGVVRLVDRLPELAAVAHLVRAILGVPTLERAARWAELAWLSGREPRDSVQNASDSVPSAGILGDGDVLHVLSILSTLAAPVAPIVLVFDQLENLATEGTERVLAYGNVISELVDSVPCLTILQLALTSEFLQFIEPHLSLAQRSRVAGEKILLELPSEKERRLLLRAWQDRLSPPTSQSTRRKRLGHPLSLDEVHQLLTAPGMTPRLLATAYARALAGKDVFDAVAEPAAEPADRSSALASHHDAERSRVVRELEEKEAADMPFDAAELAEGIAAALSFLPRLEIETRSERERYFTTVRAPGGELVIVYLTAAHHSAVAAGLTRAAELARSSKVAIVREQRFDFPTSWVSVEEKRAEFERMPNARWLWLDRDEVIRCVTLARLSSLARARRLRMPGSEEPMALEDVRREVATTSAPDTWTSAASIKRWLDDVPRAARATPEPAPTSKRDVAEAKAEAPATPSAAHQEAPMDALRSWLRNGRTIGRQAVSYYMDKLTRRGGR